MIERFTFELFHCNGGDMTPDAQGEYVSYDDYAELQQKLDAMAAENAALKEFGEKLNDMHNNLNGEGTGIQGRAEVACQQVALEAAIEEFDTIKTPATDAYMNSVRADAVETFAVELAHRVHRSEYSKYFEDEAIKFAANLRSGTHDTADKAG